MTERAPKWLLIDGNNWYWILYHGNKQSAANCTSNFLNRIEAMREAWRVEHTVIAFDCGESWRKQLFKSYKGERKDKTQDSIDGLQRMIDEISGSKKPSDADVLMEPSKEADDHIALAVGDALDCGCKVIMASGDKDLHQCLADGYVTQLTKVLMEYGMLKECEFVTESSLHKRYGAWPYQWVDYRCITGDPSDNIPGVYKLGPSDARKIFASWSSLDDFASDPDRAKLGPKTKAKLLEFIADPDGLELHRKLITLNRTREGDMVPF